MRISRRRAALAMPAIFAGAAAMGVRAQAQQRWPTSAIRFVVAFPPGGPTDIVGRIVAAKIAEQQRWTVVVENKGGASGMLGMSEVARAAPDGHTVLINASAHSVLPSTQRDKLTFDVASSFIPVTMLGRTPLMVTVTPSLPVRSMAELLAHARANPGRLNYTSGSLGGGPHLAAELLKLTAGIDMQFVPYRGSGPGLQDLAAGNVQVGIDSMTAAAADRFGQSPSHPSNGSQCSPNCRQWPRRCRDTRTTPGWPPLYRRGRRARSWGAFMRRSLKH
jgi:tripartite-type tricarboxylate transporter receptor subunit TctC